MAALENAVASGGKGAMQHNGFMQRTGIALVAILFATFGVFSTWNITPVSAQDESVVVTDDSVDAAADETVDAAAITPGANAVVSNGPLNQRSSAGINGSILQVLSTGTIVTVISGPTSANGYSWFYVTANAIDGYVAGQYLSAVGFIVGDDVFVNSNNVNIRSGAGTSYGVIDQLDYGVIGEVIGGPSSANGYTWYKIQYETSLTGWIAGAYLTISNTPPPSGGFGVNSWILVDDPPVNLRSGAGTSYSIVTSLKDNYAAKVSGTPTTAGGYTWYPVDTFGGPSGYVAGSYFAGGFYSNDYATVANGPLNLRATASSSGTILTTMPSGASIFVNSTTPVWANGQTWFNVTYNGTTGWAAGSYIGPA